MTIDRKRVLVSLLRSRSYTPDELAEALGVSRRTVRGYVMNLNEQLAGMATITLRRKGGYSLVVSDAAALEHWQAEGVVPGALLFAPDERVDYLLVDLLMRSDWARIEDYAARLFVSAATLSSDLKAVHLYLAKNGLSLESRPRYGMRVQGSEMTRRQCLAEVLVSRPPWPFDGDVLPAEEVERCVRMGCAEGNFRVAPLTMRGLVLHVCVGIVRLRNGAPLDLPDETIDQLRDQPSYLVAQTVARYIEKSFELSLPDGEVAYLAMHLSGNAMLDDTLVGGDGCSLPIDEKVWETVLDILFVVKDTYGYDLSDDFELRMALARHIVPLIDRLRFHLNARNPLLRVIKMRMSLAYSMATSAADVLKAHYGTGLSEDEVGYLALSFALSLERGRLARPKRNILLVMGNRAVGSWRVLEVQFRRLLGESVGNFEVCSVEVLKERDVSAIDYVFTTVPLDIQLDLPVRLIRNPMDATASARELRDLVVTGLDDRAFLDYFDERLFFAHCSLATKAEVISFVCERAGALYELEGQFEALVWRRESLASTSFGGLVAIPHPLEPVSDDIFVAVVLLDQAIPWNDYGDMVQAVFLFSFAQGLGHQLEPLFAHLSDLLTDEGFVKQLLRDQTFSLLEEHLNGSGMVSP